MTVAAFVALGANLGDARTTMAWALARMAELPLTTLVARSRFYLSAPVEAEGPDYINAVAHLDTTLTAPRLLRALLQIEQRAGRTRPYWHAPRTLDLDLLLYGTGQIWSDELTVPHPRMMERAFVLRPLHEIAPDRVPEAALAAVAGQPCVPWEESGGKRAS